jgi:UDP-N-acetylglucosamine 2-epimerase
MILLDIHRPENFKYIDRLKNIFAFANECIERYNLPVKLLYFKRLKDEIEKHQLDLGKIEIVRTPGNDRLFNVDKFLKDNNLVNKTENRRKICYCRVSNLNQKE